MAPRVGLRKRLRVARHVLLGRPTVFRMVIGGQLVVLESPAPQDRTLWSDCLFLTDPSWQDAITSEAIITIRSHLVASAPDGYEPLEDTW